MPAPMDPLQPAQAAPAQPGQPQARVVSDEDKALSRELQQAIDAAIKDRDEDARRFASNRQALRGFDTTDTGGKKRLRVNLHYANLASMRPQVYAKDPEFTVQPSRGVPDAMLEAVRRFGDTAEAVLDKQLVQQCQLKRRAKRILTSAYTNAIGWWKLCWQDGDVKADPVITNRIKDTQDNLNRLMQQQQELQDATAGTDHERKAAELRETLAGLQTQAEVRVGRGLTLDFVMPEDLLILDKSIFEVQDYERAERMAHRVWMTRQQYQRTFGYNPEKARVFRTRSDTPTQPASSTAANGADRAGDLVAVFEVWDQGANRVHTVCLGEEGLCRPSYSPDWTGERWLPFFLLIWNEVDGAFLPPSDVELTDEVVREYNRLREDLEKDREDSRPFTVVRKGGSLTPDDVERVRNRKGNDIVLVEGIGNQPISGDLQAVSLGTINPAVYDTTQPRSDMEMLIGGGDAARGSVLKAKTATEAEILSQGLRGRSAERTDVIEDLLSAVGNYALQVLLRKMTPQEVQQIAGAEASWPQLSVEDVLRQVSVRVRGGSTGKPDRLQEQDRWTKLLPVIKDTVKEIVATRQAGQEKLAQLAMALLKETLRRFDERFEVEQYLPEPKPGEEGQGPEITPEMVQQAKAMIQELQVKVAELQGALQDKTAEREAEVEKARINAKADIEKAERVAKIDAAAKVEVARVTSAAPPLPAVPQPAGLVQALAAVDESAMVGEAPELGADGLPMPLEVPGQSQAPGPLYGEEGQPYVPGMPDPD